MDENILGKLNNLLSQVDLTNVSKDGAGFEELPDGYYLSELSEIKLGESKTGKLMITGKFKVVEDGLKNEIDENGDTVLTLSKGSKNRLIWKNWVLTDETSFKRYASDMLKFEDDVDHSVLEKEYFTNGETMQDAFAIVTGMRVYIMVQSTEKNGEKYINYNLVKWSTIRKLGISE